MKNFQLIDRARKSFQAYEYLRGKQVIYRIQANVGPCAWWKQLKATDAKKIKYCYVHWLTGLLHAPLTIWMIYMKISY